MNILCICYAIDRSIESQLPGISVAGNKMQINLLKELYSDICDDLHVISIYPVASYPTYNKINIGGFTKDILSHESVGTLKSVFPYILNLPVIKNICEIFSTYIVARSLCKKNRIDKIILFNAFPPTAYAALKLKKRYGCEIICLLADLPVDDSVKTKGVMKYLRSRFDSYTRMAIRKMDKLIVLNKKAVEDFAPGAKHIVVEGAVNKQDIKDFCYIPPKRKNIVFTGALQKYNGIVEVVEAMKLLKESDVVLDIYGKGEFIDYVKEAASKYSNINYFGTLSNEKVMQVQREAYLLINPRPTDDYIAQITFPSKMFEYMTSGTPVLATRLNGYTQDFLDNLFIIEENTPQCIADTIIRVSKLSEDEFKNKAEAAYNMILTTRTWEVQAKRILEFIKQ